MKRKFKSKYLVLFLSVILCITGITVFAANQTNSYDIDKFTVTDIKSGTAPFNTAPSGTDTNTPIAGADYSADDTYIRSYDDMTFNLTPYVSNVEAGTRIKITATVNGLDPKFNNNTYYKCSWDLDSVGGNSNEATLSDDKRTLTYYKVVKNSGFTSDAPILHIYGAQQGDKFTVTFTAQVENSTMKAKSVTTSEYTVSSRPYLNAVLYNGQQSIPYILDGVKGRIVTVGIGLYSKGLSSALLQDNTGNLPETQKGMGYPTGDITMKLQLNTSITDYNNNNKKEIRNLNYKILGVVPNGSTLTFDNGKGKIAPVSSSSLPGGKEISGYKDKCVSTSGTLNFSEATPITNAKGNPTSEYVMTWSGYAPSKVRALYPIFADAATSNPYQETMQFFTAHGVAVFVPALDDLTDYASTTNFNMLDLNYSNSDGSSYTDEYLVKDNTTTRQTDYYSSGSVTIDADFRNVSSLRFEGDGCCAIGNSTIMFATSSMVSSDVDVEKEEIISVFDGSKFDIDKNVFCKVNWTDQPYTLEYGVGSITDTEAIALLPRELFKKLDADSGVEWYSTYEEAKAASVDGKNICFLHATYNYTVTSKRFINGEDLRNILYFSVYPKDTCTTETVYGFKSSARWTDINGKVIYSPNTSYIKSVFKDGIKIGGNNPSQSAGGTSLYIVPATVSIEKTAVEPGETEDKDKVIDSVYLPTSNELNYKLKYTLAVPSYDDATKRKVTITDTLPKGLTYVNNSATVHPSSVTVNVDGTTTLVWTIDNPKPLTPSSVDSGIIRYKVTISPLTKSGTGFESSVVIENPLDTRDVSYRQSTNKVTVSNQAGFSMVKLVNKNEIFINEDLEYTLTYTNTTSSPLTNVKILDILPTNGILESKYEGSVSLSSIKIPSGVKVYYTTETLSKDTNISNLKNSVVWKELTEANVNTVKNVKAVKAEISSLDPNVTNSIVLGLKTNDSKENNIYENNFTCVADGNTMITSNTVRTKVVAASIEGTAWNDSNKDGSISDDETVYKDCNVYLLKDGKQISTIKTDDKGHYKFDNLSLGEYTVVFEPPVGVGLTTKGDSTDSKASHTEVKAFEGNNAAVSSSITLSKANVNAIVNSGFYNSLEITKTSNTDKVMVGSTIVYTISVKNTSEFKSDGTTMPVYDDIPQGLNVLQNTISDNGTYKDGTITWNIKIPSGGETKSVQASMIATGDTNMITNNVRSKVLGTTPGTTVIVLNSEKSAEPADGSKVRVGDTITYKVKVTNPSKRTAKDITVTDTVPSGTTFVSASDNGINTNNSLTWKIDSIESNESKEVSFVVKVNDINTIIKDIKNTAKVEGIPTNTVTHTVNKSKIESTKKVDKTTAEIDDTLTYTFTVKNTGAADTKVDFKDVLPDSLKDITVEGLNNVNVEGNTVTFTSDTIQPSKTISFTIKAKVKDWDTTELSKVIKNKATVTDTSTGVSLDTNEVTTVVFKGDLHFKKSSDIEDNTIVKPGDVITYTIKYSNKGEGSIKDISIEDTVPDGTTLEDASDATVNDSTLTWSGLTLEGNEEKSVSFKVKVNELTEGNLEETIENTAKVNGQDTNTITHFVKLPKLEQSKEVDKTDNCLEGDTLTYTINYANIGADIKEEFTIVDKVPEGSTYVEGSASDGGVFDKDTNTITWVIKDLAVANEGKVTFKVTTNNLADNANQAEIVNIAKVDNEDTNEVKTLVTKKPVLNESSPTLPKTGTVATNILILFVPLVLVFITLVMFIKFRKRENK